MARHTLYVLPGTWEAVAAAEAGQTVGPGTPVGLLTGITNHLDPNIFEVIYVNYPGSFGPISGGGAPPLAMLGSPSYRDSRDQGVDETVRLINDRPGTFGVIGFSQGGDVAAIIGWELMYGRLQHRSGNCLWVQTFGGPRRRPGHTFHGGPPLAWGGISGQYVGGFEVPGMPPHIDWFDYAIPLDIYADANPDSYLHLVYDTVTEMTIDNMGSMIGSVDPSAPSFVDRVTQEGDNLVDMARKLTNTVNELSRFATSNPNPHTGYATRHIVPNVTAVQHALNHLNYWGPRR